MKTIRKQTARKAPENAIEAVTVIRCVDWQKETPHPKLNELLRDISAASEKSTASTPVVEINNHPGGKFYLMPESLASFAIRVFAAWRERQPPFDQSSLDAVLQAIADAPDNTEMLVRILFGDAMPALDRMSPDEMRVLLESADRKTSWTALSAEELARVIQTNGGAVTETEIRDMIDDGAPVNPDGSLNFFRFTRWLEKNACKE